MACTFALHWVKINIIKQKYTKTCLTEVKELRYRRAADSFLPHVPILAKSSTSSNVKTMDARIFSVVKFRALTGGEQKF